MKVYISLGSNMGDRAAIMTRGLELLQQAGYCLQAVSPLYETPPWGKTDQSPFLNAVACIELEPEQSPRQLMTDLLAVEQQCGRRRLEKWGPRTLDLDILWAENYENQDDLLVVPHPYFWERSFVLVPLADLAPHFTFRGQKISDCLDRLGRDGIRCVGHLHFDTLKCSKN